MDVRQPDMPDVTSLVHAGITREGDPCCSLSQGPDPGTALVGGGRVGVGFVTLPDVETLQPRWSADVPVLPRSVALPGESSEVACPASDFTGRLLALDLSTKTAHGRDEVASRVREAMGLRAPGAPSGQNA
ncbi:MAG: hypothetical protein ACQEXJ_20400 [Myxococcota bacterium]